jgi:hypothetical protein
MKQKGNSFKILAEKLKRRGVDGRIIFKRVLGK